MKETKGGLLQSLQMKRPWQSVIQNLSALALILSMMTLFHAVRVRAELSTYPTENFWTTDGAVNSIVVTNGLLYLGGEFSNVGPLRAFGSEVNTTDGLIIQDSPRINDATLVRAVASDGQGGWFVAYQNETTNQIIRILADNTLDPNWHKTANSFVSAIAVVDEEVYLGGGFSAVYDANGGIPRSGVARFDLSTGAPSPWNPNLLNSPGQPYVSTLALTGSDILIGGGFKSVQGIARRNLTAVNRVSAQPTTWNPSPDRVPSALEIDGDTIYVAGGFTLIGGLFRTNLAAVSLSTGFSTPWNPNPDSSVGAIVSIAGHVIVSGSFTNIGGAIRPGLAELDKATGLATEWSPSPTPAIASDLSLINDRLFVVGSFDTIAGEPRVGGAAFDLPTKTLSDWNPHVVGGASRLIATSENAAYLAGDFHSLNGKTRKGLAALDATSGIPTDWNPSVDGFVVSSAVHDGTLYLGGTFTNVNAAARSHLAAVDLSSGAVTTWSPEVRARELRPGQTVINDILITNSTIYVAGAFTNIAGSTRENLAALDLDAALTPWNASAHDNSFSSSVFQILSYDGLLYIGGLFRSVNGEVRNGLAAVQLDSGVIAPYQPSFSGQFSWTMRGLSVHDGNLLVSGRGAGGGGVARYLLASTSVDTSTVNWEVSTSLYDDWAPIGMIVRDGVLYHSAGPIVFNGSGRIETFNPSTGAPLPWVSEVNGPVRTMVAVGEELAIGGAFNDVNGSPRTGFAVFPLVRSPRLESPGLQDGVFSLRVTGEPDAVNVLKRTQDFNIWTSVRTNTGPFLYEDPAAESTPAGFYKVDLQP